MNKFQKLHYDVCNILRDAGIRYALQNYKIYPVNEFLHEFDEYLNDEQKEFVKSKLVRIQRQCDALAMNFYEHLIDTL